MDYTLYITQALSILFAYALAKHDGAAIELFNSPDPNLQMAKFHRYNNWTKFAFCLLASLAAFPDLLNMGFNGLLSFLWIYLLFDPVLSKSRGKDWDYLGENDADGRRWIKWFGKGNAGERKFFILVVVILVVNAAFIAKDYL